MNNLTTIYVVRHGQSEFNARLTVNSDSKLTKLGEKQAEDLSNKLKSIDFSIIYSSGLRRAIQTAKIMNKNFNKKIVIDKNVNERSFSPYAIQLNKEDISLEEEMLNEMKNMNSNEKMNYRYSPKMESPKEAALRLNKLLTKIAKKHEKETSLVISHGNLMQSFLTYLGYCDYDNLPAHAIKNLAYIKLEYLNEKFKVNNIHNIDIDKKGIRVW